MVEQRWLKEENLMLVIVKKQVKQLGARKLMDRIEGVR